VTSSAAIDDLSRIHHPITKLFSSVEHEDGASLRLSDEQVQFYRKHGYVSGIRILSGEQLAALREELAAIADSRHPAHALFHEFHSNESDDPDHVLFHALGAWRISSAFHDLLWHRAFAVPASQLLAEDGRDESVRFWHDQLFCKPAHHGGVVAWHQDYSYWTRTQPLAHLTCWIGLDDSTRENGCLHYIPGSQRWPDLPITGLAGDMEAIVRVLDDEQRAQFAHPVAIELKAGEASFHHPRMVHGSFANHSAHSRRATVINVMRDGVCSATDEPLLEGIPPIRRGSRIEGQFFPLLLAT